MRIFSGDNGGWVWGRWIECYFIYPMVFDNDDDYYYNGDGHGWMHLIFFVFVFAILSNCVCFWYCRDTKFLSCSFICSLVRVLPFRSLKKHSIQFNSLSYTHSVNDNNQYRLGSVQFNSNSRNRNDTMMMMMMMNRVFCLFRLLEKWNYFVRH